MSHPSPLDLVEQELLDDLHVVPMGSYFELELAKGRRFMLQDAQLQAHEGKSAKGDQAKGDDDLKE
jgi:hypothetical protein